MSHYVVVLVTCPSKRAASRISRRLIEDRLAACVNILPAVESLFWWQGRLDRAREVLLIIKTTSSRVEALRRAVVSLHPYEVPEVLALPVVAGHPPYLRWITASLDRGGRG